MRTLLSRRYDTVVAVDAVSFDIPRASKTAYVGANGAGKSTTIKMLTGVLTPTAGTCTVDGIEPHRERTRNARNIGVIFGHRSQLWWDLSVPDSLRIIQRIYDVPDDTYRRNLARYDEMLDLGALGTTPVRQLSLGQRMRAEIAASLIHDPAVIFWDEPTIGLDMILKDAVRQLVNRVNRELGTTVFLTSHDISDIAAICDNAVVLDHGKVVHQGSIPALLRKASKRSVVFDCRDDRSPDSIAAEIEALLPQTTATITDERRVRIEFPVAELSSAEVLACVLQRFDIADCFAPEPDLQAVLREIYARGEPAPVAPDHAP